MIVFDELTTDLPATIAFTVPKPQLWLREAAPGADAHVQFQMPTPVLDLYDWEPDTAHVAFDLPRPEIWMSEAAPGADAHVRFQMPTPSTLLANATGLVPSVAHIFFEIPTLSTAFHLTENAFGTIDFDLRPPRLTLLETSDGWMEVRIPRLRVRATDEIPEIVNYGLAIQSPGFAFGYGAVTLNLMTDGVSLGDSVLSRLTALLVDTVLIGDSGRFSPLNVTMAMSDGIELREALNEAVYVFFSDAVVLGASFIPTTTSIVKMIDKLILSDVCRGQLEAINTITDLLAMSDVLGSLDVRTLTDQVVFSEAYSHALTTRTAMVDEMIMSDAISNSVYMLETIADTAEFGDTATSQATVFNTLADGFVIHTRLVLEGATYFGYVVNTANRAVSEYDNFPFNSYAKIGRTYFATGQGGVYRLEGDDDDGSAISASIKSGLSQFGTGRMKRMPSMYLGYTADSRLVLKMVTTDGGTKTQSWYQLNAQTADVTREGRVKIGRGLKARYWQWELVNVAGGDFTIDTVELFPMILEGRI